MKAAGEVSKGSRVRSFQWALALAVSALLFACLPAVASAAECTDTYTGPWEGSWTAAVNWSAGTPGEADVACVPSGKKVNLTAAGLNLVRGLQGEGILAVRESTFKVLGTEQAWWIGSLDLEYEANLTGPGTLEIRSALEWKTQSTMSGAGVTVLGPSSVNTIGHASSNFTIDGRIVVNEGTTSQENYGTLRPIEGGVFENLGTYDIDVVEGSLWQIRSSGAESGFVNVGTFRNEGLGVHLLTNFVNLGTIDAAAGTINFEESGYWLTSAGGSNLKGPIHCEGSGVLLETMAAPGANLTLRKSQLIVPAGKAASLGALTMDYEGNVGGAGTLEISKALSWISESTMAESGATVIGSSATATVTSTSALLVQRTLVNEGTLALDKQGEIVASEGARIENNATLNADAVEDYGYGPGISTGLGFVGPELVNNGTIHKTGPSGKTRLDISVENNGTIDAGTGTLLYNQPGAIVTLKPDSILKGTNRFEGSGIAGENFSVPSGTLSARESVILLEGESTKVANLKIDYGTLVTGTGHLEVTEALLWEGQSTFAGTGTLTLGSASDNVLDAGATTATLSGWFLVNKGTFTQKALSTLNLNGGAVFENRDTYKLNSEPSGGLGEMIVNEGGGVGAIINKGEFIRTEGKADAYVVPDFENLSWVKGLSSKIEIENPKQLSPAEKAGCSKAGDPVSCATGDFSEHQTDIAIGGRGVGLVLARSYSAQAAAAALFPGPFGYGWSGSFTDRLAIEEGGAKVTVVRGSGQTIPFTRLSGTTYAAPSWSQTRLSGSPEAGYTATTTDQTAYRFSGTGRLEAISDRNGNETTLSYDEAGHLSAVTDPAGRALTFAYNAGGQVESATDPLGHVVKYAYEGGNLASVTMPGETSPRWQFKYDGSHRITQVTDGRGGKTTNEYDSEGRVTSQTDPAGRTLAFKYEGFHTTITNKATGEVTDEWFTSYNEPFSVTHGYGTPEATTRTFTYNEGGQVESATDGTGHTTEYGYDSEGNRTSQTDPLGHETKWAFNSTHDLVSTTTPRGETTTIKRDSHGNVEAISRPAPGGETQTTSFKHGSHGELESATNPLGKTWTYGYDSYGDRSSETDPLGDKQTLAYDKDSRLVVIVSPRGNVEGAKASEYETTVQRDAQGRPTKVTDPLGHSTEYAYDANGNLASTTDAKGQTTKYTYNADDERTKVERPSGATLQTGYDGAGYLTSQTDGNGKTTTYVRNVLEQPVEVIDPLGHATHEEFDSAGNLAAVIDPEGRKTSYSYDAAGRLIGVDYSEAATPDATFGYDADGNVTAIGDGSGESSFAYDQLGRLTCSQDGHGEVVEYAYNLGEQQTAVVYPNGKSLARAYDAAGRLESVTDWLGGKTSFAYDAESNLKGIAFPAASGDVDEYAYDRAAQMSEARFKKGSETLASLTYTRDALGQVEAEARHGLPGPENLSYGYDADNRLTKAGSSTYGYDAAGNLTKAPAQSNTYDAASQLEKGTGATYSYDKEGERTGATNRVTELPAYLRAFGGQGQGAGTLSAPRDVATDKEGNLWVADTAHNRVQEFSSEGEFVRQFGTYGTAGAEFSSPSGIAVSPSSGHVFVADTGNKLVKVFTAEGKFLESFKGGKFFGFAEPKDVALDAEGHLWVLDGQTVEELSAAGAFIRRFGKEGSEAGQFNYPEALALDAAGNVWVADTGNNRVQEFKSTGEFIRKWGTAGSGAGQLSAPRGLAFDAEGDLWVADSANDRLQRFAPEGAYLASFGAPGNNPGEFVEPRGLAIDAKGRIWIADTGNDRVQESSGTETLRTFGGSGSGAGTLAAPRDVATDKEGNLWVADTAHNRVQEFSPEGEFLRQFGTYGTANNEFNSPTGIAVSQTNGHVFVADQGNKLVKVFTAEGKFLEAWKGGKFLGFGEPKDVALDPEGHLWVLDGSTVEELSATGTYIRRFGKEGSEAGQFSSPAALTLDAAGNVWVADTGNNRIQEFKSTGEFIRKWGAAGSGTGQLSAPRGLAFDAEGDLWVADSANDRLQRFSPEGAYLASFGAPGNNPGEFVEPRGLAIDAKGRIWIADTGNDRVQESSATETLRTFGGQGSGAGRLSGPRDAASDSKGNLWVADTAHNRVQEFSSEGEFVRQFGTYGTAGAEFSSPSGIAVSPSSGHVFVADTGNKLVKVFTAEGKFLESFKGGKFFGFAEPKDVALDAEGHLWVLDGQTVEELTGKGEYIRRFGSTGSEAGQLSSPEALAVDNEGNLWVADTGNNRIQEFSSSGAFIRKWGTAGSGAGQLSAPRGLAFDSEGDLWVSDSANDRLQRFSPEGTYLAGFGAPGNNPGEFVEPRGLAIDAKGNIWLADTGNDRVQEFAWPTATTTYGYDQAGDLTSIARPKAGENPAINQTLAYDATGLITAKTSGATTKHFAWDASTGLPLLLNDGEASYIYGPGGLPIEQINAKEEPTYLHHDQLGSTRLLTGSGGATSASVSYTPYGSLEAKTGTATSPLGFAGQYTDAETGLQYLRARFYEPQTGQFLRVDPLVALTHAPYAYARSNPLANVDPSGNCGVDSVGSFFESVNPISEENCAYQAAESLNNATGVDLPHLLSSPAVVGGVAGGICLAPASDLVCGAGLLYTAGTGTAGVVREGLETEFCDIPNLLAKEAVVGVLLWGGALGRGTDALVQNAPFGAKVIIKGGPAAAQGILDGVQQR